MAQDLNSPSFEGHAAKSEMKAFTTKWTMVKKNLVNKEKKSLDKNLNKALKEIGAGPES